MNWAYIAGFFDGEGCISTRQGTNNPFRLTIVQSKKNNGESLLNEIGGFLSGHQIRSGIHLRNREKCPMVVLYIGQRRSIVKFLLGVMPYLRVKRILAQDVLRYSRIYPIFKELHVYRGYCEPGIPRPWTKGTKHLRNRGKVLTLDQARSIFALRNSGRFQKDIAKEFGVCKTMVHLIWSGKRWFLG